MPTYEKTHYLKSLVFDTGCQGRFADAGNIGANVANTTVQTRFIVTQRMKIYRIAVNYSAIGSQSGSHLFNIVVGTGVEGTIGATDTIAPAGTVVFGTDQKLTNAPDTPQWFIPDNVDVIYETGTLLTLRAVTPGGGSITTFNVAFFAKTQDSSASLSGTAY